MAAEKKSSYKKLFSNTLIFALGSFSSKVLIILLVNVYTHYLTRHDLGVNDIIQQIANWLLPIVTMTISESVVRFGLDKAYDKKQVFSIANLACLTGLGGLAIVLPIVTVTGVADRWLHGYSLLIFFYIAAASMKLVYSNFLRAIEMVRLYAINSIFNTALTLGGTILFICVFRMGNRGYLLSIILSDAISTVFMFFAAKMWRYADFKHIDRKMVNRMISYSLPLIPAQLMWLVTNSSDSFMTTYFLGEDRNGILSSSYKIANLVSTVYMMFGQAWNMSAILEDDSDDRNEFYANVFYLNQCLLYILAAGCLMICMPLTHIWMGPAVWESARYAPILIYSTIFSCFTTFMGSIYLASNQTKRSLVTSMIAGIVNVSLNLVLIPAIGLYGPPITTVVSYIVVFIVRSFDSRKIVPFDLKVGKIVINCLLLLMMTVISVMQDLGRAYSIAAPVLLPIMFVIITAMNIKPVWNAFMRIMPDKVTSLIDRIGISRLIALAFAAAVFAVVCWFFHIVLLVTCLVVFSAAAAFGSAGGNRIIKLGGLGGIFFTVWAAYGISTACLAVLVLSALLYLYREDSAVCALGCICFIGVAGSIGGIWTGLFCGLLIMLTAIVCNMEAIGDMIGQRLGRNDGDDNSDENRGVTK